MIRFVGRVAFAVAGSLLMAGCADGPAPTAPETAPALEAAPLLSANGTGKGLEQLARFDERPNPTVAWAKAWIGPAGGRLDFLGFAIEVPAGAVDRRTQFSIRLPVDPMGAERVVAEFGPHNVTFARPVAIELPYAGTSTFGETPQIGWWNPHAGEWVAFPTAPTDDGQRIRTLTDHFSTYGSMARFGTSILLSGG